MQVNEIPSPTFVVNEQGRVSVFLPSFEGEPEKPVFVLETDSSIVFNRTEEEACVLSGLSEDTMDYLKKSSKCLVIEVDLEKAAGLMENEEDKIEEAFHRLYEVSIVKEGK